VLTFRFLGKEKPHRDFSLGSAPHYLDNFVPQLILQGRFRARKTHAPATPRGHPRRTLD
jgi:hypothetical protein